MLKRIRVFFKKLKLILNHSDQIINLSKRELDDTKSTKILLANLIHQQHLIREPKSLHEVEFQVFSQWGDDGIIQYLISKINIEDKTFIEFGVENYIESNTRFLLINNHWTGLVIDGSNENIEYIRNDKISWACELMAIHSFITEDNINTIIKNAHFKNVGLLSVDIDGNDYWIWKTIDDISPVIVIAEYNSLFGKNTKWTIPYDATFVRGQNKLPFCYYGASLGALSDLAEQKGYSLIGCNSKGNNAYFIRNDKLSFFEKKTVEESFVYCHFTEAFSDKCLLTHEKIEILDGLPIYDITNNEIKKIDTKLIEI